MFSITPCLYKTIATPADLRAQAQRAAALALFTLIHRTMIMFPNMLLLLHPMLLPLRLLYEAFGLTDLRPGVEH